MYFCNLNGNEQVYYKNNLIGKETSAKDEYIWIRQIKKGMTTKQVRWTWGKPEDIYAQSKDNVYWYFEDGSMAKFYKGKLQSFIKR